MDLPAGWIDLWYCVLVLVNLLYCVYMLKCMGGSVVLVWVVGRYVYISGALPWDDAHGNNAQVHSNWINTAEYNPE